MAGDIERGEETLVETNTEGTNPTSPVVETPTRRVQDVEEEKESIMEASEDYDAEDTESTWVESGLSLVVRENDDNPDILVQSARLDPAMIQREGGCQLEMASLESSESLKPIDTEKIPPIEVLNLSDDEWMNCLGNEEYEIMFYHGTDESDEVENDYYEDSEDGRGGIMFEW